MRHGAKVKLFSSEGCTNQVYSGGVCWRHGANRNRNPNVESTVFGSEYEKNTATLSHNNQHTSRGTLTRQGRTSSVPGEVTIFCQEIEKV